MRWRWLVSLLLMATAAACTGCGPDTSHATSTSPAVPPPTTMPRSAGSLSGTWIGTLAGASPLSAVDVVLNISDTSHTITGNASLTVREAPADCPAAAGCLKIGDVIPASVTGSVRVGARVAMQWTVTIGGPAPTMLILDLEGVVAANRMSGTVTSPGGGASAGAAAGTWSVSLR